jgi:hypothetical protein
MSIWKKNLKATVQATISRDSAQYDQYFIAPEEILNVDKHSNDFLAQIFLDFE